ncbi:hypothetical protein PF005_g33561 [Phytophthora fragariae]|uniref:Uncharacterized protein n=1 Tax=Phytophthora fragariae TaxID=53985 RepID=A0A6A3PZF6_9STRA|nr:hypothetical protein PF003_g32283 [Phytophthora fragariae]KAE8883748.1 hypothetical protein PF003_g32259 [Phytophthora fragariae]KAE8883754.1 hypothetical protein PF003_g32253 [Phytophthora fragariae]KAE8920538.1 hypothetical protein PF009_g29168 [Phytophthora fragariae]KAE8953648.1 hypothetical protein PF011_g32357 [Phytophthora fragariae]
MTSSGASGKRSVASVPISIFILVTLSLIDCQSSRTTLWQLYSLAHLVVPCPDSGRALRSSKMLCGGAGRPFHRPQRPQFAHHHPGPAQI